MSRKNKIQIIENSIWFDGHKVAEFVEGATTPPMVLDRFKDWMTYDDRRWY